jgi:hypothetical protein
MPVGVFGQSNSTSPLVMTRHERIRRYDKMLDLRDFIIRRDRGEYAGRAWDSGMICGL